MILQLQMGKDNKILRTKSQKVVDFNDPEIKKLIKDMEETLSATSDGIGLAAPQVGQNIRLFVLSPAISEQTIYINPVISKSFRRTRVEEGCLSLPKIYGTLKRAKSVKIRALDEKGQPFMQKANSIIGQVIQHEIDHLDGTLFIDKADKLWTLKEQK